MEISVEDPTTSQWNEELCLQLIDLYRMSPQLWDEKHSNYFKKVKKDEAWKNIGRVLGKSPQDCKHKMGVLFSSFRREKAKIMKSIRKSKSSGGLSTYASNWFGFAAMSFLLIKEKRPKAEAKEKPRSDSLQKVTHEALEAEKVRQAEFAQRTKTNIKDRSIPSTSKSIRKSYAVRPDPKDEELKSFSDFVASKMKKYSESTRSAVQQAICDILFKADQSYYERANSTVTSTNVMNMMSPRVVIRPEENVQALIVKEEDLDSGTE